VATANAISIVVTCHRIIGSSGDLVGYTGGLPTKKKLLDIESNLFALESMSKRYPILVTFVNFNGNEYHEFVYDTSKRVLSLK